MCAVIFISWVSVRQCTQNLNDMAKGQTFYLDKLKMIKQKASEKLNNK